MESFTSHKRGDSSPCSFSRLQAHFNAGGSVGGVLNANLWSPASSGCMSKVPRPSLHCSQPPDGTNNHTACRHAAIRTAGDNRFLSLATRTHRRCLLPAQRPSPRPFSPRRRCPASARSRSPGRLSSRPRFPATPRATSPRRGDGVRLARLTKQRAATLTESTSPTPPRADGFKPALFLVSFFIFLEQLRKSNARTAKKGVERAEASLKA